MIYMAFPEQIKSTALALLETFSANVAVAYDGLLLREETDSAQRATISILGGAIESRSREASLHLQRMGDVAVLLAQHSGLNEHEWELLRIAASLHDVGKVCIAESILNKPGPLSDEEWSIMKTHAELGQTMLSRSSLRVHEMAALIAKEHHERWDGTGYPLGLQGDSISLAGRISAVADVLDSLVGVRCYKAAWPLQEALQYLYDNAGTQFDPSLIAIVREQRAAIEAIYAD
jgi:response regulator RpfG family c-di-GMP phosphodiesterase